MRWIRAVLGENLPEKFSFEKDYLERQESGGVCTGWCRMDILSISAFRRIMSGPSGVAGSIKKLIKPSL